MLSKDLSNLESPDNWHGKLNLVYAYRHNSTQLINSYHQSPLKIQRPFYPESKDICHSTILHTAGGVVGGDKLTCTFHLQTQSQALITTAAANKIYRSNGHLAQQNTNIYLADNSCLEWFPQETIVFDGAIYRQNTRIELDQNATFIGWEITRFGRSARGEKFLHGDWRSYTEVWQQGQPLWIDRQWFPGCEEIFHSPHGLAGKPVVGTFVYVGQQVSLETITQARCLYTQHPLGNTSIGVSRLEHGFLCRYRGTSTSEVRNWFTTVWQLVRQTFLERSSCIPRVWQT